MGNRFNQGYPRFVGGGKKVTNSLGKLRILFHIPDRSSKTKKDLVEYYARFTAPAVTSSRVSKMLRSLMREGLLREIDGEYVVTPRGLYLKQYIRDYFREYPRSSERMQEIVVE